jgi:acetyl esterase/lipase
VSVLGRRILAGLGTLLAAGCSPTMVLNALSAREGVLTTTDLAYAEGDRHGVDVYAPAGAQDAPTILFLYGGSWNSGERGMYRFLGATLAQAGVVVIVPDYRVYPEVRFPAFMTDAARAVAWAHRHAARHGGAPDRLVVMGHSAGAQMATLLALDPAYLAAEGLAPNAALRGVVGLAGPYDFLPLRSRSLQAVFGAPSEWPASQPVNFVTPGAPRMLLATGDDDTIVLPRNTAALADKLRASGNAVETITYPGVGHLEIMGAFAAPLRFLAPVRADVLRFVTEATA